VALLKERPDYPGARDNLNLARYGLAQQYAKSGKWQEAVDELDALLKDIPGDTASLDLMKDVYDRWWQDAVSRGDILTAIRVGLQRDARFPAERK
jgi:predicted Zn-dependent protease